MKIEFGIFLKIRRESDENDPEEIVSAASTTAAETERSEPMAPDTTVRTGFQGARA